MSNLEQLDRYTNPPIPSKTDLSYKGFSELVQMVYAQNEDKVVFVQKPN